jgi:hypothetical protein
LASNVFDRIFKKIEKVVNRFGLNDYADETAERVRRRVRLGGGVEDTKRGGARTKLKQLSPKYKKARKRSKKLNKTKTKPNKSNLTFTGQLLDAIKGRSRGKKIVLEFKENRDDGLKNSDIAGYVKDQGRDFFELTDKEIKGLRNSIKKDLIKKLRKK